MKRLALLSTGVLLALIGFTAVLYFLPINSAGHCAAGNKMECSDEKACMHAGGHSSHADGKGCAHKGGCTHGNMHKEVRIEMHGACGHKSKAMRCEENGEMKSGCAHGAEKMSCGGTGEMAAVCGDAKSMHGGMEVMGCCCCKMMMMHHAHGDSIKVTDSVRK
jgi:hypothetical protein